MDYSTYLGDAEKKWAHERLTYAKTKNYKTIVLMHHQVVSSFWQKQFESTKLVDQLAEVQSCFLYPPFYTFSYLPSQGILSVYSLAHTLSLLLALSLSASRPSHFFSFPFFLFFNFFFSFPFFLLPLPPQVDNNIIAWMWGHEHRLVVMDDIHVKTTAGQGIN
jgi:hypothetical protein